MSHVAPELSRAERRILDQATTVLADGRGRTMQEIADLSGVGRTTLYRHFRTREDLIDAIVRQAHEDAAAIAASRDGGGQRRGVPQAPDRGDSERS